MRTAALFLNGRYDRRHFSFYKSLCRSAFKVAVDGGYRFFSRSGVKADLLIGDLDSLNVSKRKIPKQLEVLKFSVEKGQTDAELAILECLKRGYKRIDLIQPSMGSLDHCLGNLMLLEAAHRMPGFKQNSGIRLISRNFEAQMIIDRSLNISGRIGETLSVIPLSDSVRYSCQGLAYGVELVEIRRGETLGLRNKVIASRARVSIEGTAAVILLKAT